MLLKSNGVVGIVESGCGSPSREKENARYYAITQEQVQPRSGFGGVTTRERLVTSVEYERVW
jgi:hypothetical protein